MAAGPTAIQRDVQSLFEAGTFAGLGDGELVERCCGPADAGAEAAFETLVRRHGPMVWRVCRGALGAVSDAEDAFQATFLVLAARRGSLRKRDSLASWLYGIAARVSARARAEAARRKRHELAAVRIAAVTVDEPPDEAFSLAAPVVQEEVGRLPEKYRSVVLLCYWDGLTHEQAAARLGCPIGTVRSRVARARDLLRRRLLRRGLSPASAAVAALTASTTANAVSMPPLPAPPPDLVRSVLAAAMPIAAGTPAAGIVPAGAASLSRKVLWSLTMMKLTKFATAAAAMAVLAVTAHSWAERPRSAEPKERLARSPRPSVANEVSRPSPGIRSLGDYVIEPPDLILVEVLEALPGRPISGERLVRPDGKVSLGWYGEVHVAGLTINEAKAKIIKHLQKTLSDDALGLCAVDEDGNSQVGKDGKPLLINPSESETVFVDVTGYNSKFYYVEGEVTHPDRLQVTGNERVLDAIHYVGGLLPSADISRIKLIRNYPPGPTVEVLPIDYDQITMGTDSSTNYQLMPGDRLVVPAGQEASHHLPSPARDTTVPESASRRSTAPSSSRPPSLRVDLPSARFTPSPGPNGELNRRMSEIERKLDVILKRLDNSDKPK